MSGVFDRLGRHLLFALDPETAHGLSIAALKSGVPLCAGGQASERLRTRIAGIDFLNPLGMAAGYDKNAEVPDGLLRLGFGFAEVGTVTPLPQPGNPRPRIFRLEGERAVINRLGFNNEGHERALARLARRRPRGVIGVNIGANKDSVDRIADYELGVRRFAGIASYLTVNVSSPNTPGLRNLQGREMLAELLSRVMTARDAGAGEAARTPIFLKIAPDLDEAELDDITAELVGNAVDGLIVSNTTIGRHGVRNDPRAKETGGLSGRPLFRRSTAMLAKMRRRLGADMPIIGVGGVDSAETAIEKIRAGADLVQLYTGLIYGGPSLPGRIVRGLDRFAEAEGLKSLREMRDSHLARWADEPL
ncbi:MAG: dihydroorotate dehydrogenase (quinone) [Rhizobiales bacterium 65-79]|nr:MAG: dihydroorotate dehydrogenase (quinone) [Rhizobiales bacterium 65-79]